MCINEYVQNNEARSDEFLNYFLPRLKNLKFKSRYFNIKQGV